MNNQGVRAIADAESTVEIALAVAPSEHDRELKQMLGVEDG
jgi:hypothetical protein